MAEYVEQNSQRSWSITILSVIEHQMLLIFENWSSRTTARLLLAKKRLNCMFQRLSGKILIPNQRCHHTSFRR